MTKPKNFQKNRNAGQKKLDQQTKSNKIALSREMLQSISALGERIKRDRNVKYNIMVELIGNQTFFQRIFGISANLIWKKTEQLFTLLNKESEAYEAEKIKRIEAINSGEITPPIEKMETPVTDDGADMEIVD